MLREEMLVHLNALKHITDDSSMMWLALDMAIKELEQEPCEDCVSRQAVDTLVDELARAISDERCCISRGRSTASIMQDILDLPPATPQPKTGHWIKTKEQDDAEPLILWKCSECLTVQRLKTNYCPNCGAKMVEPQESEDNE